MPPGSIARQSNHPSQPALAGRHAEERASNIRPSTSSDTERDVAVKSCDVCIVGAVDRRQRVGGMWVDTYQYVRLHQPHPMFTAGNIQWTLGPDRSYLATKAEVLDHFQHCLNVIKQRLQVDEFFGWAVESHDDTDGIVRITCRSLDGQRVVIEAKQLIKAYGFQAKPNEPLEISSERILSVSPDFCEMRCGEMRASDTPVWIIGGGNRDGYRTRIDHRIPRP